MTKKPKELTPRRCVRRCGKMAMSGHALCESCLPTVPVRKPFEETLAMIDKSLEENTYEVTV